MVMTASPTAAARDAASAVPVLDLRSITKRFGPVTVLDSVDFTVRAGEVHALVGENGAGKSTLIRVIAGDHVPDGGELFLGGQQVRFAHPSEAMQAGIGFVHQIPMFIANLSVTENLLLGVPFSRRRAGLIDWAAEYRAASEELANVGLDVDPRASIDTLRPHERQLVALARALKRDPRILVLDEVTASLSEPEVRILHDVIRRLRGTGVAIIYVSHRLEEIFRLADWVTVLRDGRRVASRAVAGLSHAAVAELIVGSAVDGLFARRVPEVAASTRPPRLRVRGLGDDKLDGISFDLRPNEILGLAGLGGSGRSRLLHMLFGARPSTAGSIELDGVGKRFAGPDEALAAGIALLTEDRHADGYVQAMPVWQNVTLPWLARYRRFGFLNTTAEQATARQFTERLQVRMPGLAARMAQLSGGNQQKVLLGRWLSGAPKVLLLDEPTHGVDIRSKGEIHAIIRGMAEHGIGVIVASSELEEIEALCHRILLLRDGRLIGEYRDMDVTKARILHGLLGAPDGA
jgi:ABC-type sugar transport system ATPase subunit